MQENEFSSLLNELKSKANNPLALFNKKIINSKLEFLGLYTKELKSIANKYKNIDINTFELNRYYEINFLYFYIYLKRTKDLNLQLDFIKNNLQYIDTWAIVDQTSSLLVDYKFETSKYLLSFDNEYLLRYAYVCLLKFTKDPKSIDYILSLLKNDVRYYVIMSEAWLLSYCFINDFNKTYSFYINNNNLNKEILLIGIQKTIDSYRVSKENKLKLKELRKEIRNDK